METNCSQRREICRLPPEKEVRDTHPRPLTHCICKRDRETCLQCASLQYWTCCWHGWCHYVLAQLLPAPDVNPQKRKALPTDWRGQSDVVWTELVPIVETPTKWAPFDYQGVPGIYNVRLCGATSIWSLSVKRWKDVCESLDPGRDQTFSKFGIFRPLIHATWKPRMNGETLPPVPNFLKSRTNVLKEAIAFSYGRNFSYRPALSWKATASGSVPLF